VASRSATAARPAGACVSLQRVRDPAHYARHHKHLDETIARNPQRLQAGERLSGRQKLLISPATHRVTQHLSSARSRPQNQAAATGRERMGPRAPANIPVLIASVPTSSSTGTNLLGDEIRRDRQNATNPDRILRGKRGDGGRGVAAQRGNHFGICLDARTATGIRSGNDEHPSQQRGQRFRLNRRATRSRS
jgi:hypothetical protein